MRATAPGVVRRFCAYITIEYRFCDSAMFYGAVMPNHITNRIIFEHPEPRSILSQIESAERAIDFERLIPAPESLKIESGSNGERAMECLLAVANIYPRDKAASARQWLNANPEAKALGQQYLMNIAQYGYPTWYEWNNENWGTKWNAYKINTLIIGNLVWLTFQTAWSPPWPVIEKVATLVPSMEFWYIDEGRYPNFWGKAIYTNGVQTNHAQNCDDDLAQLNLDLHGDDGNEEDEE